MLLAIEEMKKCNNIPKVGAVIVKNNKILAKGHKTDRVHAERSAIEYAKIHNINLDGCIIYATLEPCVRNKKNANESCSELISNSGISSVVIGTYDINPLIYRTGWRFLRDKGLKLRDFDADIREDIKKNNVAFNNSFEIGIGPNSGAKFDYTLNGGNFEIQFSKLDKRTVITSWSTKGIRSIYAYGGYPGKVALAKYANEFDEIDDPLSFDFRNSSVAVKEGEIAIFKNEFGCGLVKVIEVHSGNDYGSNNTSLKIEYEVRPFA